MLVECKSADIRLSQNAFNQVAVYNMTVNAKYIAVSNGRMHFCCEAAKEGEKASFLEVFPEFG
jgi:predicted type IV restriction endonuclease